MHLRHSLKKSMPALHDFVCCCCCCCFFFLSLSAASFIVVFHVTSWPPCWWMVNKRSLISSLCLSASICSFHHCYLCLPRLHENHLYHSSSQTTLQWSKFGWIKALKIRCNVAGETNCLTRLIATVPEEFFLASFLKWLPQIRFASISTPERFWRLYWFTAGSTIDVQNERCS